MLDHVWAHVYHAVEREWAVTVEDVVRRRTTLAVRGLASPAARAEVARVMASSAGGLPPAPWPP